MNSFPGAVTRTMAMVVGGGREVALHKKNSRLSIIYSVEEVLIAVSIEGL